MSKNDFNETQKIMFHKQKSTKKYGFIRAFLSRATKFITKIIVTI